MLGSLLLIVLGIVISGAVVYCLIVLAFMSSWRVNMAQGDFTKEEAAFIIEAFDELYKAMPPEKKVEFLGHANDIFLFLEACKRECPSKED